MHNINTHGYQNWSTNQYLYLVEYFEVRESLYTRVINWVDTILYHIDTRMISPRYEGSCMVHWPKWYQKQKHSHAPNHIDIKKMQDPHYRYPNGIKKRQHWLVQHWLTQQVLNVWDTCIPPWPILNDIPHISNHYCHTYLYSQFIWFFLNLKSIS